MFWKNSDMAFRKTAATLLAATMLATACVGATTEAASPVVEANASQIVRADSNFGQISRSLSARQAMSFAAQDGTDTVDDDFGKGEFDDDEFFEGVDWFSVAADMLGMDEEAFWQALEEGKTIAEMAAEANVDVQTIIDALKTAETDFLNQLVADGVIAQEEADEWLTELDGELRSFVEEGLDAMFIGVDWFTVAAEAVGLDEEALWEAMESGKTLADIAAENGVEAQAVIDAVVAAETADINKAVADGKITQEEADEWLAELPAEAKAFVEEGFEECDDLFFEEEIFGVDWFSETAKLLNMDEDAMWEAIDSGQSIADLAAAAGVDTQTIIDTLVAADTAAINQAVTDGELTQEEADEWLQYLPQDAADFVNEDWSFDEFDAEFFEDFEDDFGKESDDSEPDVETEGGNA